MAGRTSAKPGPRPIVEQESEQEDGDENGQIHLLNCYQKRMKTTSGAELEWPIFDLIGIPETLNISGG